MELTSVILQVTIVVCDRASDFQDEIKKANELSIPVVSFAFLTDSVANKKQAKPEDHKLGSSSADDAGPSTKKAKTDDVPSAGIHKDSEWMGVSTGSDNVPYPFVLKISGVDGDNISGAISWPTLGKGAVTKIKGTVKGDQVKFEEYEAVHGADDVEIPMHYTGKLTANAITGKLKDSVGTEASFTLTKIKSQTGTPIIPLTPTKDLSKYKGLPTFTPKTEFKGVMTVDYPFKFQVQSLTSEGKVEGVIEWPTASAQTKVVGSVKDNGEIVFEEKAILVGAGVDIPAKYTGKVDDNTLAITGKFEGNDSTGTFSLEANKKP